METQSVSGRREPRLVCMSSRLVCVSSSVRARLQVKAASSLIEGVALHVQGLLMQVLGQLRSTAAFSDGDSAVQCVCVCLCVCVCACRCMRVLVRGHSFKADCLRGSRTCTPARVPAHPLAAAPLGSFALLPSALMQCAHSDVHARTRTHARTHTNANANMRIYARIRRFSLRTGLPPTCQHFSPASSTWSTPARSCFRGILTRLIE
jgi:hypothetical protein